MTKKEHEVLQKYFNRIREFQTKGNESFNKLMELNGAEGTGHRWVWRNSYKGILLLEKT